MSAAEAPPVHVPKVLLAHLLTVFPLRPPRPGESHADCMVLAGESRVLLHLRELHEAETRRALEGSE